MNRNQLESYADRAARRYGVNPAIFRRQIGTESSWNVNARSPAGAGGIAQFIESTARRYGVNTHDGDPRDDLMGAARMMHDLLKQNGGDYRKALSAYNSGRPDGYKHIAETKGYVQKILGGQNPRAAAPSPGGSSAGGMSLQMGTEQMQVEDPELAKKQYFAQWFAKRNPASPLVKLGVVDPGMSTTKTVGMPTVTGFKTTPSRNFTRGPAGGVVGALVAEANKIDAAQVPYLMGGGHQAKQVPRGAKVTPLDCSGAVSRVLGIDPRVSSQFLNWGKPGRGKRVTIWAKPGEGANGHVLMEIDGHFFGTSGANPGGGAGWIPRGHITKAYLANFVARHPGGM